MQRRLTDAGATFVVQIGQAGIALLAAGTGDEIALATLGQHALADYASANGLVASVAPAQAQQQDQRSDG